MFTFVLLLAGLSACFASPALPVGQKTIGGRIVGGREGTIEEVPYLVSVQVGGSHSCGGTIVSEYWVVSAAHCFTRPINQYTLRAGSTQRGNGGSVHALETIINHAQYGSPSVHSNDIALLKVATPFQFSESIQPASLPAQSQAVADGTWSTISGWGRLRWLIGAVPQALQIAEVPIVSQQQCRNSYGTFSIGEDMLCAGFQAGGIDACQGDSGGPLVIDGVLFGAVSWGRRCAARNFPGVYASVPYFRDWITENSGL